MVAVVSVLLLESVCIPMSTMTMDPSMAMASTVSAIMSSMMETPAAAEVRRVGRKCLLFMKIFISCYPAYNCLQAAPS